MFAEGFPAGGKDVQGDLENIDEVEDVDEEQEVRMGRRASMEKAICEMRRKEEVLAKKMIYSAEATCIIQHSSSAPTEVFEMGEKVEINATTWGFAFKVFYCCCFNYGAPTPGPHTAYPKPNFLKHFEGFLAIRVFMDVYGISFEIASIRHILVVRMLDSRVSLCPDSSKTPFQHGLRRQTLEK